jgi:hypothetical protein
MWATELSLLDTFFRRISENLPYTILQRAASLVALFCVRTSRVRPLPSTEKLRDRPSPLLKEREP